jgi:pyruvate,water dikinase
MPKVLGTVPENVTDPILIEIFGMHHHFFDAIRSAGKDVTTLTGVPASAGVVRGIARVLHNADELHRIAPGEILVCEATSPNWTPAFGKIAACVCDGGGTLTHASIISREYRIPCVVGVGLATSVISDGDEIEVDGTKGIVRVTKAASSDSPAHVHA